MLKEAFFIFSAVIAVSLAYPAEETVEGQPRTINVEISPNQEPLEPESLEEAESANPQWGWGGHRGWGGGYGGGWGGGYGGGWGGGYGRGWGGGYGRGWGGGGWGHRGWGGGGWGHRGYGWGR